VVDCGLARVPRFDPASGMSRLVTIPVSQATAEQRRGRAGRLGPGRCYRLWSEAEHRGLAPFPAPEVASADLAPIALAVAEWGATVSNLAWLDPPPAGALGQASALLEDLGAVDLSGRITNHGRLLAALPLHPRLGHMLVRARAMGLGTLGADLAAVLGERDFLAERDSDLARRIEALRRGQGDSAARHRIRQAADQMRGLLDIRRTADDPQAVGVLVALAYPDRIAQARSTSGQFRMSGGGAAVIASTDALARSAYLAIADLDGDRTNAKIYRAAALDEASIEAEFADRITTVDRIFWDQGGVQARRQRCLGQLVLRDQPQAHPPADQVTAAVIAQIRAEPGLLSWSEATLDLQRRVGLLHRLDPDQWPDWSQAALLERLEDWLRPHLGGLTRAGQLAQLSLQTILADQLDWSLRQRLEAEAPTHLTVPSGSRIALDYSGERPVLAVKLQEMFGATASPTIARGRVVVQVHLLSPARRPVQVTDDLAGFWTGSYRAVRADLRGRYPKHPWPDDPLSAVPTARTKARAP
jgi:ATP-dependent helicase HrpB